jgi:hypothetical protein
MIRGPWQDNAFIFDTSKPVGGAFMNHQPQGRFAILAVMFACMLAGCGGGGDGGGGGGTQVQTGALSGSVQDRFGKAVAGATVCASLFDDTGCRISVTTNSSGQYTASSVPTGSYFIRVAASDFTEGSASTTVSAGQTATANVTLQRLSEPIAGMVAATLNSVSATSAVFTVDIYVADASGTPIQGLSAADFTISNFTIDGVTLSFTQNSVTAVPQAFAGAYSAMLLLDQSGSITTTDPTDARLFAAKVFLEALGPGDNVMLSAFSSGGALPFSPVTAYGSGFTTDGRSYFGNVDELANLVGGGTPLFDSTYIVLQFTGLNAPNSNRAVVVFSDGMDTSSTRTLDDVTTLSQQNGVRIFVVGLSGAVDFGTLSDMATKGRGAYFQAANARQLIATFGSLGRLLNGSATVYSSRWSVTSDAGLGTGFFQTGVRVRTQQGDLLVPFRINY